MKKTIFVSIAAQDDEELRYTVKHIFQNADYPENVFVGIALTSMKRKSLSDAIKLTKKYNVELDFVKQKKNDRSTLGIGKGRSRASELYSGQDYMIQVDCHSFFDTSWDTKLITLFKEAKSYANNEKIVLSAIPPIYEYCCRKHKDPIKTGPATRYPFYETQKFFIDVIPKWSEVDVFGARKEKFLPSTKVSPAFIMGDKKFAKNPGIHKPATFYDEDLTQSINLFNNGFSFVFPNIDDLPVRHLDSNGIVGGHKRFFILQYLNQENKDLLHENMKKQYLSFVKDPQNKEAVEKYKRYAKVDPVRGCYTNNANLIPESFR